MFCKIGVMLISHWTKCTVYMKSILIINSWNLAWIVCIYFGLFAFYWQERGWERGEWHQANDPMRLEPGSPWVFMCSTDWARGTPHTCLLKKNVIVLLLKRCTVCLWTRYVWKNKPFYLLFAWKLGPPVTMSWVVMKFILFFSSNIKSKGIEYCGHCDSKENVQF